MTFLLSGNSPCTVRHSHQGRSQQCILGLLHTQENTDSNCSEPVEPQMSVLSLMRHLHPSLPDLCLRAVSELAMPGTVPPPSSALLSLAILGFCHLFWLRIQPLPGWLCSQVLSSIPRKWMCTLTILSSLPPHSGRNQHRRKR